MNINKTLSFGFLIGCCLFVESAAAAEPECLAVVDRQAEDLNKSTDKLKDAKKSGRPMSALQRDMMRLDSTVSGLKGHLESCKKENPRANFAQAEKRVSASIAAFEQFKSGEEEEKAKNVGKKTWMDAHEYHSHLRRFPATHPSTLDHSASFIFTRDEVVQGAKSDGPLKKTLADVTTLLTSDETKRNFEVTIKEVKGRLDKDGARKGLEGVIKDLTHMQAVFAPDDPNLSALISEAKDALKSL